MTRIPATASSDAATPGPRSGRRATISSAIGFTLDFYDLYVAVFVAPVLARLFFPTQNPALSLAGAFGTLAATLLTRPFGAAVMGSIADRHGRKRAMLVSLLGVGTVTAAMGVIPSNRTVGVLAPVLLLILRLAQGLFVGGVFASTLTLAVESVSPRWRGLASGLVGGGGTAVGSVLASLSFFAATRIFPGSAFDDWGWRSMFLVGGLPILLGLLVVRRLEESPLWTADTTRPTKPIRILFGKPHRPLLALNILLVFGIGTHFLLTLGFLPTYLAVVNGLPRTTISLMLVLINLATLIFAPLTGHLSQHVGRRRVMLIIVSVNTVALPLLYWWLAGLRSGSLAAIVTATVLVSCLTIAAFGPLPVFLSERFSTRIRASGIALSINGGFAVAGLMPTVVNAASGSIARLPFFAIGALIVAGVAAVVCLSLAREPGRSLS